MSGDTMNDAATTMYCRGYNDATDGEQEYAIGMTAEDLAEYRAGVQDARRSGHLCTLRMRPRKETNDGRAQTRRSQLEAIYGRK